jgi:hypothetical protein
VHGELQQARWEWPQGETGAARQSVDDAGGYAEERMQSVHDAGVYAEDRVQSMHPGDLAALLRDPQAVAAALIRLRSVLPRCDVGVLATRAPHLLQPAALDALAQVRLRAFTRLRALPWPAALLRCTQEAQQAGMVRVREICLQRAGALVHLMHPACSPKEGAPGACTSHAPQARLRISCVPHSPKATRAALKILVHLCLVYRQSLAMHTAQDMRDGARGRWEACMHESSPTLVGNSHSAMSDEQVSLCPLRYVH